MCRCKTLAVFIGAACFIAVLFFTLGYLTGG